ncbi:MAG: UvrD-helicase domain-containing protein [Anaerolineae bacterium]|jgi:thymidine kinase|nr:UvrD-helicase domain-containing protein [Anaerolineae bacterium]
MATAGERRVLNLLRDLPRQEYFFSYEPRINTPDGIQSKPDFVVVSAKLGILVLEIKDWTRLVGGNHEVVHTINHEGVQTTYENPYLQAERYAYDLNKRFEARAELWEHYRGRTALKFPWQPMVILPYIRHAVIQRFEAQGIFPKGVFLGMEQVESVAHLQQAFKNAPWRFSLKTPITLDILDIVRELIHPELAISEMNGQIAGTLTRAQHQLIIEPLNSQKSVQLPLFEETDISQESLGVAENATIRLVRGVAGSGKTLVLVKRAQHLIGQYPDSKILVLSFNKDLAKDLRERIQNPAIEVTHFHSLCAKILVNSWKSPIVTQNWLKKHVQAQMDALKLTPDFVVRELEWRMEKGYLGLDDYLSADRRGRAKSLSRADREAIHKIYLHYVQYKDAQKIQSKSGMDWADVPFETLKLLDEHPLTHAYDAILIDEGQDFAPSWMAVVKRLLKPNGALMICDDPSQSIFRNYTWQEKGISVVGRSKFLRVPFRSTREISLVAHALIEADATLKSLDDRPEPDLTSYELASGTPPPLFFFDSVDDETAYITQTISQVIAGDVKPYEIAILAHDYTALRRWDALLNMGVYVAGFQRMKGLEFKIVYIPSLNNVLETVTDDDELSDVRRKLFTAMTRAKQHLILSAIQTIPDALKPILDYLSVQNAHNP